MKTFHGFFGNFIDTARVPGMTAQQPANRHGATAHGAVALDRRDGITGTGRMEAAVPAKPGTQQKAIYLYESYQEPAHVSINRFQIFSSNRLSSLLDCAAMPIRPMNTISRLPNSFCR